MPFWEPSSKATGDRPPFVPKPPTPPPEVCKRAYEKAGTICVDILTTTSPTDRADMIQSLNRLLDVIVECRD